MKAFAGIIAVIIIRSSEAVVCLRNADIGHRPGNVYTCKDPDRSACCELKGEFTCCEPGETKYLREQIQLWGCVLLFIAMIVLMYVYLNKDLQFFSSQTFQEGLANATARFRNRNNSSVQQKNMHRVPCDDFIINPSTSNNQRQNFKTKEQKGKKYGSLSYSQDVYY